MLILFSNYLEPRGRFSKEQTLALINNFGSDYFNPNMLKENRQKLLIAITQRDEFQDYSVDEIKQKLEYLAGYYKTVKGANSIKWKYYDAMHKIMQNCEIIEPGGNVVKESLSFIVPGCAVEEEMKTPSKRGRPKKDANS